MAESGKISVVAERPIGTSLVGDHDSGVTELLVLDRAPFSETGGTLTIGADTYAYGPWDGETDLEPLTLTAPTTAAYEDSARVLVDPAASELVATVVLDEEGEGIEAIVRHDLRTLIPEGIRTADTAETVVVVDTEDGWQVDQVVKETPSIDAGYLDPNTMPPTPPYVPTEPPTDAPLLTIAPFAIGALLASWTEVDNAQWYDVYASLTPGFDSDDVANRVLSGVTGLQATVASISGTQIPVDGATPVYVVVKAVNVVDDGPASNEESGTARQADAEFLSALYAWFGTVEAQSAILGSLNVVMNVDVDGVFAVGDRITIADPKAPDGKGGIIVWGDDEHTIVLARLHPDGNYLDGILVAQEITVIQALRLIGDASAIASGAKLKLENGVANPAAPTLAAGPILQNWPAIPTGYAEKGIAWDSLNGEWLQLLWRDSNSRGYLRAVSTAGEHISLTTLDSFAANFAVPGSTNQLVHSIAYCSTTAEVIVGCRYKEFGDSLWAAGRYQLDGTLTSTLNTPIGDTSPAGFYPTVGSYGGMPMWARKISSTKLRLTYEQIGGPNDGLEFSADVVFTGLGVDQARAAGVETISGTTYLWIESTTGNVRYWDASTAFVNGSTPPTLTRAAQYDFAVDSGGWAVRKTSGASQGIYTSKGDAKLAQYSSYYPAAGEKWWAAYNDNGAGGIRTAASPESDGLAVPARRFVTVTLNPAPAGVTGADVYVGIGTTAGPVKYKRVELLSVNRTMTLLNGVTTFSPRLVRQVTNKALASNVATLTSANHALVVGDIVTVAGVDSTFNGTYTITAVTTNTFSYAKVNANASSASASGTAVFGNTMGGSPAEIFDDFGNSLKGDGEVELPGLKAPFYHQEQATGTAIPDGAPTIVKGFTADTDVADGGWTYDNTTGEFTCTEAGLYHFIGQVTWPSNTSGARRTYIYTPTATYTDQTSAIAGALYKQAQGYSRCEVGDKVTLRALQNSGGSLTTTPATTYLQMVRHGR